MPQLDANVPPSALIKTLSTELEKFAPRFDINASDIQVLETPSQFYSTLKEKIANAKRTIFLSTLYIGKEEIELVETIKQSLKKHPQLRVVILADALRGTRENPQPSCSSLMMDLMRAFPSRVLGFLYHTPNLTGWRRKLIPKRINEGWGLQHMKLYCIDDEIILSGANLSSDYFTNRQDRYHLISSKAVTSYYKSLFEQVCSLSYLLAPNDRTPDGIELKWTSEAPSPISNPEGYIKAATKQLQPFLKPSQGSPDTKTDTILFPVLQLTPILRPDNSTELPALKMVLRSLSFPALRGSTWMFTAGYFNMTPEVRDLLLAAKDTKGTVLAASPWANGFYGSKGVSGLLPAAYTYLARSFLHAAEQAKMGQNIVLKEWRLGTVNQPGGWTYHAKGMWVTLPGQQNPSITLIGSSNYTKRSYSLDLEANAMIMTTNPKLQARLGQEQRWLQKHASTMTQEDYQQTERRVGFHVRIAMWLTSLLGGAL